eukprot:CAMPEP_0172306968 /NCGR_PEP_ID=MMETSP1058-20130122/7921_1 /TAXON_ID=83371 /ORGANISM="Detonula confervacea, Strain CCMP 353" /LENGTH=2065 /DNA_ID=CAMNT_0013019021 /DNA_START=95 /DNA_END=6292 /DNA_ORIENTATION=-
MWSNFAQRPQQPQPMPPLPPQQQQQVETQQQSEEPYYGNNTGDDNAWSDDDDILLDDSFDDVNVNDNNNEGTLAPPTAPPVEEDAAVQSTPENAAADGWDDDDDFLNDSMMDATPKKDISTARPPSASTPAAPTPTAFTSTPVPAMPVPTTTATYTPLAMATTPVPAPPASAARSTPLARAAEHFGAALLASMDHDEEYDDDESSYTDDHQRDDDQHDQQHDQEEEETGRGGGFGSGFVMKGLSRFIAAAAPREERTDDFSNESEEGSELGEDDGWGDDDDLDFHEDVNVDDATVEEENVNANNMDNVNANVNDVGIMNHENNDLTTPLVKVVDEDLKLMKEEGEHEPNLHDETPMMGAMDINNEEAEAGEGWDEEDIDISFNTPQQKQGTDTSNDAQVDSEKSNSNGGVSDSIMDFVAMTESTLDMEFTNNLWKTPPPKSTAKMTAVDEMMDDSVSLDDVEEQDALFLGVQEVSKVAVEPSMTTIEPSNLYVKEIVEETEAETEEKELLSKSLTEFVDNLDAELNDFNDFSPRDEASASAATSAVEDEPTTMSNQPMAAADGSSNNVQHNEESYSYDENKNHSPEPLRKPPVGGIKNSTTPTPKLAHQESWYLNAMEGGKGGVVYGEDSLEPSPPAVPKGHMLPIPGSIVQSCPSSVGMPLSEMPSVANSLKAFSSSSIDTEEEDDHNAKQSPTLDDDALKLSELQCNCLELIMPLPNDEKRNGEENNPGFGTKKLPNGTSVLVNYEKLLQNEATKRILLQRSVEAYELRLKKLEQKHESSLETLAQEHENQLTSARSEVQSAQSEMGQFKEMVIQLQDEKEIFMNEKELFEAEVTAVVNDKEYLEREVEIMEADIKVKDARNAELLQERQEEKNRLVDQVEMLQADLSEVQEEKDFLRQERDLLNDRVQQEFMKTTATETKTASVETETLRSTVESLQQELLEKDDEIEQLNDQLRETLTTAKQPPADHDDDLHEDYDRLHKDFAETKATLSNLHDENESLRTMQREYDVQLSELKATIESMDCDDSGEVDKLAAEVASLTYELGVKTSECEESAFALQMMQTKLDNAEAKDNDLHEGYDRLQKDFAETKSTLSKLRDENESLRTMQREYDVQISEWKATVESMDCDDSGEVDKLAAEVASLTYELGVKTTEFEEASSALQLLQTKVDNAEVRHVEGGNHSSMNDAAAENPMLRAENGLLYKQLKDLQGKCNLLKSQKSDLENSLEDEASTIQCLEMQIQSLNNAQVASEESAHMTTILLQEELVHVKTSLNEKVGECVESTSALHLLQAKLDDAEAAAQVLVAAAHNNAAAPNEVGNNHSSYSSEVDQSLRAENGVLSKQLADLQGAYRLLEGQKLDLVKRLEESASAVQSLGMQIQDLNAKAMQSSNNLRGELSSVRKSLYDKVHECETIAVSCEQLKTELLNTQSDREVILAKSQEDADEARDQISRLQSQLADLLKDHNATMKNVEEQLTNSLQQSSNLHTQCEEYRMKLENAEKECASISHSASDTIAKYNEQISMLQGENLELSTGLQKVQSALLESKQQFETSAGEDDSKVKQLQRSIDSMKEEMESIAHLHQELLDKNHCLMQEKADITQSFETRASTAEQQTNLLQLECAKFRSDSQNTSAYAKKAAANLQEQVQALRDSNAQLEDKLFEASFETPEAGRLAEENASLRKERDELKEETLVLSQRINELASQVDGLAVNEYSSSPNGTITSVEKEALLARINTLEEELKAENGVNELRDELTSLHEERDHLDLDNEELLVQLGLMQQDKLENQGDCEVELESLREQVSTLQDQCTRLHYELEESRSTNKLLKGEVDHYVKNLQDKSNSLRQTNSELFVENESLKDQISDLVKKIEAFELLSGEIGDDDINDDDIKTLRQQLGLLELKLADKEVEVESGKKQMKHALDSRDLEIFKLATECSSREKELKDVSSKLDDANNEMGTFNTQLESLQIQHDQDQHDQVVYDGAEDEKSYEDEDDDISLQDLLVEAVLDSDDYLRSQIVVLAQALERSELQRADALERIFTERKTNGDSLRQLGESVKRFYSTVRCSGAA